jgi:hypothetical protein
MFRRVLMSVLLAAFAGTGALAQSVPVLLTSGSAWRPAFLSLDSVQVQVDATLLHAAASKRLIAVALAQAPPALLPSTPLPRR